MDELKEAIQGLTSEFREFKTEAKSTSSSSQTSCPDNKSWAHTAKHSSTNFKSSLCVKSNEQPIDLNVVKQIAVHHSIQVSGTSVKSNEDVYVYMSNVEHRDKMATLLAEKHSADTIVKLKSKMAAISILNVETFVNKNDFITKVKQQNPEIKEKIESGSEFTIVFVKEPMPESSHTNRKHYQVVARVNNEIREGIKKNKDKIYVDLTAHRIVDRFYIKRCNKCQKFGYYQDNCTSDKILCGFCCSDSHCSSSCPIKTQDTSNFSCLNCKDATKIALVILVVGLNVQHTWRCKTN